MMIRPATHEDVVRFYGEPAVPVQMVMLGDVAIAGLAWCDDGVYAVSWLKEGARNFPGALMRLGVEVARMAENAGCPVYATPDPDEPTAARCLKHLGFEQKGDRFEYRTDLPGRIALRHAHRTARPVSVDAC